MPPPELRHHHGFRGFVRNEFKAFGASSLREPATWKSHDENSWK